MNVCFLGYHYRYLIASDNIIFCVVTSYFDNFLPEFGIHNHTLRNDLIRLPAIRCEFGEMNAKYQMHLRLRELAFPLYSTAYPFIEISEATLDTSIHCFSNYLKTQFVRSYSNICNINDCFVCNNSN